MPSFKVVMLNGLVAMFAPAAYYPGPPLAPTPCTSSYVAAMYTAL